MPMYTHCSPSSASETPSNIQNRENVIGPSVSGPKERGKVSSEPKNSRHSPGLNKKKFAPYTNIARRLIQAAYQGENQPERLWWLKRPARSFRKRIGTSAVRSFMCTDLSTISEAYSHDCDCRSMRTKARLVMPRMPQWMSENLLPKMVFRIQVVTGVPR